MMYRFEFVVEMSEDQAARVRDQIDHSRTWYQKLGCFFSEHFGVDVINLYQFSWSVARDLQEAKDARDRSLQ